ncbi:hypothetical protein [Paraburkholderia susongensis]|uniref:Uncharacterized protein n=1 Tax=Paraburkholderia susongensis TaxID=1515439 RepID=A0A1X7KQ59_9BURK|nr:hypothetical protein [Paraburkholderia susongensis]SMG43387.1 hypothetical protein SAMN06265784_104157 [Paraburkholderia susongensis]
MSQLNPKIQQLYPWQRVLLLTLALPFVIVYAYAKHLIQELREDWPALKAEVKEGYHLCWTEPRG